MSMTHGARESDLTNFKQFQFLKKNSASYAKQASLYILYPEPPCVFA